MGLQVVLSTEGMGVSSLRGLSVLMLYPLPGMTLAFKYLIKFKQARVSVEEPRHSSYDWPRASVDYLTVSDTGFIHLHITAFTMGSIGWSPPN